MENEMLCVFWSTMAFGWFVVFCIEFSTAVAHARAYGYKLDAKYLGASIYWACATLLAAAVAIFVS